MENDKNKKIYPTCAVLEKLMRDKIPPALFIGAGISKRYLKDYPTWLQFVEKLGISVGLSSFDVLSYFKQLIKNDKSETEAILLTTTMIESKLNDMIASGQSDLIFTKEEQEEILCNNIDNIKFLAKKIFQKSALKDNLPQYKQKELNLFSQLKNNIPYIFTTNYDNFIEDIFNDYKCFISQSDYLYNDNSEYAEIYKLHGSYTSPNSMIFTENDYKKFEELSYLSIAKLVCILAERPIVFMGYSIHDPDILSILQKIAACLDEEHIKQFEKNLIVINWVEGELKLNTHKSTINLDKNKSLTFTYISTDNYCRVLYCLQKIQSTAKFSEIRRMKKLIKELVDKNDEKLPILIRNVLDVKNISNTFNAPNEIAATLGENISPNAEVTAIITANEGLTKMPQERLFIDALKRTESFSAHEIITEWFSERIPYNTTAPLYFYLDKLSKKEKDSMSDKLKEKLKIYKTDKRKQINDFLKNPPNVTKSNWEKKMLKEEKITKKLLILCHAYYSNNWITKDKYREILIGFYDKDNKLISVSAMKKAILLLDYK